jgi:transposase
MSRYIGLDVHKRVIEVCVVDSSGSVVHRERLACERDAITRFAEQVLKNSDAVALEATTNTWAVVAMLEPVASRVVVANPLKTRAIAEARIKTDKIDALVLAQLLRADFLPAVWIPDQRTRRMRSLTHRRAALTADLTAIKNRIHAVLHERLIHPPVQKLFCASGIEWLTRLELDQEGRAAIDSDLRLLRAGTAERDTLDQTIDELAYDDKRIRLLMTLPGISVAVAAGVVAAWGDPTRFPDADRAAAYLGLVPSTRQSADTRHHGSITKSGSAHARWLLVQAAQHASRHAGPIGVSFRRLCRRKNRNVAIVACARKLARIAWLMLRDDEPYRYAMPASTRSKLAGLRVRVTGQRRPIGGRRRSAPSGEPVNIIPPRRSAPSGEPVNIIPPLNEVLTVEGLNPAREPQQLPEGERKVLRQQDLDEFVRQIHAPQYTPRTPRKTKVISKS